MMPMDFISMIRSGQNPQQLMLAFLEKNMSNTPMGANLLNLARNNDRQGIENIARNLCAQQGIDYDTEFAAFRRNLGL